MPCVFHLIDRLRARSWLIQ